MNGVDEVKEQYLLSGLNVNLITDMFIHLGNTRNIIVVINF
jgi:hypothetical protein